MFFGLAGWWYDNIPTGALNSEPNDSQTGEPATINGNRRFAETAQPRRFYRLSITPQ